jgi:hypothetical protein
MGSQREETPGENNLTFFYSCIKKTIVHPLTYFSFSAECIHLFWEASAEAGLFCKYFAFSYKQIKGTG